MTRKDYISLAGAISDSLRHDVAWVEQRAAVGRVARRIAATLAKDNPRFDRARFLKACGVEA